MTIPGRQGPQQRKGKQELPVGMGRKMGKGKSSTSCPTFSVLSVLREKTWKENRQYLTKENIEKTSPQGGKGPGYSFHGREGGNNLSEKLKLLCTGVVVEMLLDIRLIRLNSAGRGKKLLLRDRKIYALGK